jgi:hypothetical protein
MVIEPLGYPLSKQNPAKNGYRTTWISTFKAISRQKWLSNHLDIHFQGNTPPKMVIHRVAGGLNIWNTLVARF